MAPPSWPEPSRSWPSRRRWPSGRRRPVACRVLAGPVDVTARRPRSACAPASWPGSGSASASSTALARAADVSWPPVLAASASSVSVSVRTSVRIGELLSRTTFRGEERSVGGGHRTARTVFARLRTTIASVMDRVALTCLVTRALVATGRRALGSVNCSAVFGDRPASHGRDGTYEGVDRAFDTMPGMADDAELDADLLALAVRVAAGGAALAQDAREQAITEVGTKSTDTDVVTAGRPTRSSGYIVAELAAARPGRRGARRGVRRRCGGAARVAGALDPRPDRRHRQLPLRPAALRRVARGRGRRRSWSPAWCATRPPATSGRRSAAAAPTVARRPRRADRLDGDRPGPGADRHRIRLRPGATGASGARCWPVWPSASGTSAGSARPRSICAWPPRAASTRYYEKGLNAWDHGGRRAGRGRGRAGGHRPATAGRRTMSLLVAAPPAIHGRLLPVLADLDAAGGP